MSRYLQRVLARTTGRPLAALKAAPTQRWSSQVADPFAAVDTPDAPTASSGREHGEPAFAGVRSSPSVPAYGMSAGLHDPATRHDGAARPSESEANAHPAMPALPPPIVQRIVQVESRRAEPREAPSTARDGHANTSSSATTALANVWSSASMPAPTQAVFSPTARATPREERRERATLELPPASSRREPSETLRPAQREPSSGSDAASHAAVLAPPERATSAAPSAPARSEVVIGRISVVVESARPAPAPRTIVRHVPVASGSGEDRSSASQRFGRFGLGQL